MNGHPTREEDFDLLALGVLEGDEKQAIEVHIVGCPGCAQKLAEARGRVALFALAPPHSPSPRVKERLLQQIREPQAPRRESVRQESSGGALRWLALVLFPASVALAISTVLLWKVNTRLNIELQELRETTTRQAEVLALVRSLDSVNVKLNPSPGMPPMEAHVMFNTREGMLLYSGSLPAPPPDKTYQLWLIPMSGNPISEAVFSPKPKGEDFWVKPLPPGVVARAFAVTLEPAGGMPQPTGPKILVGNVPGVS